jgi:hypothetical protein
VDDLISYTNNTTSHYLVRFKHAINAARKIHLCKILAQFLAWQGMNSGTTTRHAKTR